ncbi:pyruvate decarboxylase 2 [Pyrus ussuriensis x Pyrus communis]|uniref:pyruvate decarboxylase n=1 Tax=Pyrus ussuriensis x Pyrus communis TaxID=2448454 RepID=A0A5N5I0T7_9ROSA|nr:pyruvate decarboxylase 2 [Pyrus ussuriensis x Pyrus communis]
MRPLQALLQTERPDFRPEKIQILDHLIAEPGLTNIGCCNELNAGYAADGYARSRGVGACVVTFTVGGLSVLNAIAGAYIAHAGDAFVELADASGYAQAVMPSAKGLVPEHHPHFIGTYWGAVSTAFCAEIVESANAYLFAGPIFNDYSSVGYSLLIKKEKAIVVQPDRVTMANGPSFGCVLMKDFLRALAKKLRHNNTAHENYRRIFVPDGHPLKSAPKEPLRVNVLFHHPVNFQSNPRALLPFFCNKRT